MGLLNAPMTVHGVKLPNRLVLPPMATAKSDEDGRVTDELCAYYAEKTEGGHIGLVITEHAFISQEGKAGKGQLSIAGDGDVTGLKRLVSVIHGSGSPVIAQLNHAGGAANPAVTGCEAVSACGEVLPGREGEPPRAMTGADIRKVADDFAQAARRAQLAGYDGVEIHSAHGYLLNQFYSPLTNHRTDGYTGATLEGRLRLHLEVYRAIRQAVGDRYLVALRLGACDYREGGSTIEDSVKAAQLLEAEGLDLLDISGGFCGYIHPDNKAEGYFSEITEAIKAKVRIPVILTGGVVEPAAAEALLQGGKADLIGVGRAILKDSKWPKKAMHSLAL